MKKIVKKTNQKKEKKEKKTSVYIIENTKVITGFNKASVNTSYQLVKRLAKKTN
jgi:hypothetical protein